MKHASACCAIVLAAFAAPAHIARLDAQPAAAENAVVAGDLVIDPPTLINLGFEWLIEGDANRSASVEVSYRKTGETAWRAGSTSAAAAGRARQVGAADRRHRAQHVCRQHPRPRTGHELRRAVRVEGYGRRPWRGTQGGDGPHASRTDAVARRPDVPRLPARVQRREGAAGLRRPDVRVQPHVLGHRLRHDWTAACEAGRHHPGPRRPLPVQPLRVHDQPSGQQHRSTRRHLLLHRRRHRRQADRHQGRRRRRGDLRRCRQLRALRRAGGRLHLLRGHHVQER